MKQNIGDYTLVAKIADGGMGEVFKAVKRGIFGFEKPVVIKTLLPFYSNNEDFIKMLSSEARLSSLLSHPNIVQTIDFFRFDEGYYLVMEYVNGVDLGQLISRASRENAIIDPNISLYIMSEILKGLRYAHDFLNESDPVRIIHRDISAQNILVSCEGVVKIADFGIALSPFSEAKTKSGELKGKAKYMSPEQIKREVLDERSDLFSASVLFYELLFGKNPFQKENEFETLKNIAESEEPPPFPQSKSLNPKIAKILEKALSRDKNSRYGNAGLMLKELMNVAPKKVFKSGQERLKNLLISAFPGKERLTPIEKTPVLEPTGPGTTGQISLISRNDRSLAKKSAWTVVALSIVLTAAFFILHKAVLPKRTASEKPEGTVSIKSYPWSKVYINGKEVGDTPIKEIRLKEGDYLLNMVFPDGRKIMKNFTVKRENPTVIFEKPPKK